MVDILSKEARKMKNILIALVVLLIIPSILHAEESYFLACEDVKITINNTSGDIMALLNGGIIDREDKNMTIPFKKGNLFRVANGGGGWVKTVNKYKEGYPKYEGSFSQFRSECWSDSGEPVCPLQVVFTTTGPDRDYNGFVELTSGCWFGVDSEKTIPVKNMEGKGFAENIGSFFKDRYKAKLVEKTLDKEIVDAMCSPHSTQLSVAGHTFTDIKMEKSEKHLKWVEKDRLHEEARRERIRQEEKAKEEKARIEREEQRILREKEAAKLKAWQEEIRRKYGVEKVARIGDLEINPYEYEGRTIAVLVQFQKMLSSTSAIFFSGYTNLRDATGAPDQIIVTGIPKGTHFKGGFMAPKVMLALKGKGTIDGTNAFGARIRAPHFQWVGLIYRE